jgi:membrane protease subunit HflK
MRYLGYAMLVALAAYSLTAFRQIRPGERAIVRRFGRVVDKPGPGLWIGLPYGMDRVDRIPVDLVRRVTIGYQPLDESEDAAPVGQLLTGDQNLVNAQVLVDYTVADGAIEDYLLHAERAEGVIARATEAVLAEWIAARTVDEVLIRGKAELPLLLRHETQNRIAPYRIGVTIQGASIAYLYPPNEVKRDFDEVNRAQTAIRTREYEARQEANRRLRQAEAEKNRTLKLTAAYVHEQLALARAEADSFEKRLRQYQALRRDNPRFLAGIWWEEMTKLFTQMKESGRLDLLDNHLGSEGLDITESPMLPRKK